MDDPCKNKDTLKVDTRLMAPMEHDNNRCLSTEAAELRRRAEERLHGNTNELQRPRTENETQKLIHELEVHQIELEMQNTELHAARNRMETMLGKYTDLYDFAPVSYFTLDRQGVINALNLTGASLLGLERGRLLGQSFDLFVPEDDRLAFSRFLRTVFTLQAKETCEMALLNAGKLPHAVQLEAIAAANGQECFLVLIDITARKQAEAEVQRLASFPLMNPNPILELDINGRMTFSNPACQQLLGNADNNDSSNPLISGDMSQILRALRDKKPEQFLREIEMAGRNFEEHIYVMPLFQAVRIYLMDITERKRAGEEVERLHTDLAARAAELEAANIELEAFNFTVSHDLRKPLTVINSYCQVVQELCGSRLNAEENGYIREMYAATLRMTRLIDTLLDFSRVAHNEIRHDQVDLSKMAEEVILDLQFAEPERRVSYRIAAGVKVSGDARLFRVVLNNLIGNAWKYSAKSANSRIEFGVIEADGKPASFVRDNGIGFDMRQAENIFTPFQRLAGKDVEGHGIGLATVERIIRRHGGRVWAESEPDKGATFFFTCSAGDESSGTVDAGHACATA